MIPQHALQATQHRDEPTNRVSASWLALGGFVVRVQTFGGARTACNC